jgi:beta-lactam-binding protein with PASTA domain
VTTTTLSLSILLLSTGCVPITTSTPFTPRRSHSANSIVVPPNTKGDITIPSIFGMSKDVAIATLRRAGYQGTVTLGDHLCGSVVDGRVIEIGQVCEQHPGAGQVQGARLPIRITVQTESPWAGNFGRENEWRLMPKLVGKSLDQARTEMQRVGFVRNGRVHVAFVDEPGCAPMMVCRTNPDALVRAGVNSVMTFYVGRDPNANERDNAGQPQL